MKNEWPHGAAFFILTLPAVVVWLTAATMWPLQTGIAFFALTVVGLIAGLLQ